MNVQDAAEGVQRAASAVQHGGAVVAVGMTGTIPVTEFFGMTVAQWQIFGIAAGAFIGLGGLAVNTVFKWLHYRLAVRIAKAEDGK